MCSQRQQRLPQLVWHLPESLQQAAREHVRVLECMAHGAACHSRSCHATSSAAPLRLPAAAPLCCRLAGQHIGHLRSRRKQTTAHPRPPWLFGSVERRAARKARVAALQRQPQGLGRSMPIRQGGRLIGSQRDSQSGEERVGRQLSLWRGRMPMDARAWASDGAICVQACHQLAQHSSGHNSSRNARAAGPPVPRARSVGSVNQLETAAVCASQRHLPLTASSALPQQLRLPFPTSDQASAVS